MNKRKGKRTEVLPPIHESNMETPCPFCNDTGYFLDIALFSNHFCCNGKRIPPEQWKQEWLNR